MKISFISTLLMVALVAGEPPLSRQQYYFAQQREEVGTETAAPYPASGWKPDGPAFNLPQKQQNQYGPPAVPQYEATPKPQGQYGPPAAPQFEYGSPAVSQSQYGSPATSQGLQKPQKFRGPVPQKQLGVTQNPQQQYGPPKNQYGAPESTATEDPDNSEFDEPTTARGLTESESEPVDSENEFNKKSKVDDQAKKSGQYFVALPDGRLQRVRYVSREDVEAMKYFAKIRAENVEPLRGPIYNYSPLQKLEITPGTLQVAVAAPVPVESSKPEKLVEPRVEIEPLTQVQYQVDNPASVVPLSSSYSAYTANYQLPALKEQRFIISV